MRSPQVLVLGDANSAEMRPAFESLCRAVTASDIRQVADTASVQLLAANGWFADVAVVFQSWPDQFSSSDVRRLLTLFPLARWICCYGSWCASDGRTRNIWPPGMRVPICSAARRIRLALDACRHPHLAKPALPWTASLDEIFAADCPPTVPTLPRKGIAVEVRTPDTQLWFYLRDLLAASGCRVLTESGTEPAALVYDVDPLCEALINQLRESRRNAPHLVLVALSGLAHPADCARLRGAGVDAIVDKLASHFKLPQILAQALAESASLRDAG